jgi:predicted O-methyltransferase YrrM
MSRRISGPEKAKMPGEQYKEWFAHATFTTDWTSHHFDTWDATLRDRRERVTSALEIGAWEGRSTLFWLNYFPCARVTCIDTFAGSTEHHLNFAQHVGAIEQRFDANIARFAARIEKLKAHSRDALPALGVAGRRFDFAYLDGSHRSVDVYADAWLTWPLIRRGGVLLFDDYTWEDLPDEMDRPRLGIDAFLASAAGTFRELHRGLQVLIEKV